MNEKLKKGYSIFVKYYMYFFVAAVVGWVYEVLTIMIENGHGFQNRGSLFGPYIPVYGFGMVVLVLTVSPIKKIKFGNLQDKSKILDFIIKVILVFIAATIVTTVVELITSYLVCADEWTYKKDGTGTSLWYYSANEGYDINFEGRIALKSSIRFGIGGTILLYLIQPLIDKFAKKEKCFVIAGSIFLVIFLVDAFITFLI